MISSPESSVRARCASSLEKDLAHLPLPVTTREIIGETGYASTDPLEYITRTFMCNPLLNDLIRVSFDAGMHHSVCTCL